MMNRDAGRGRSLLLVALGALLGIALLRLTDDGAARFPAGALFAADGLAAEAAASGEAADYAFFTFRRNIWVVHRPTGRVQFFMFPEDDEQQLVRSRVLRIDPEAFPREQVEFQLSERNLTNFLWVMNPFTGKAQYVRAGRDGVLEASPIENLAGQE